MIKKFSVYTLILATALPLSPGLQAACRALCLFAQPADLPSRGNSTLEELAQQTKDDSTMCTWICEQPPSDAMKSMMRLNAACVITTALATRSMIPEGLRKISQPLNLPSSPRVAHACQLLIFPLLFFAKSYLPEYPGQEAFSTIFDIAGGVVITHDVWNITQSAYHLLTQSRSRTRQN